MRLVSLGTLGNKDFYNLKNLLIKIKEENYEEKTLVGIYKIETLQICQTVIN